MFESNKLVLVDSHVHFYDVRSVVTALDSAVGNFRRVSRSGFVNGILLLAQGDRERVFEQLVEGTKTGKWVIRPSIDEPQSLIAITENARLALICGRQVRTSEGLEVQCVGTTKDFPDGLSLAEALETMHSSVGLTVIPWGLGKWTGRRLELLQELLNWIEPGAVFLGDSGGRLGLIDAPPLLVAAERMGFRILPGSDPFPLFADIARIGSYGFYAELELSQRDPWRVLRDWLRSRPSSPLAYGRPMALGRFLLNQGGIRVYQRYLRLRGSG